MKIHPSQPRDEAETALLSEASLAADWNHKEEYAVYDVAARQTRAFASEKRRLLLAGLLGLVPWLHQWHSAVDLAYGVSPAKSIVAALYGGAGFIVRRNLDGVTREVEDAKGLVVTASPKVVPEAPSKGHPGSLRCGFLRSQLQRRKEEEGAVFGHESSSSRLSFRSS